MIDRHTIKTERRASGRWYWCFEGEGTWKGPFATEVLDAANADQQMRDHLSGGEQRRQRAGRRDAQNCLAIEIACECLNTNGFANLARNKDQGTFPHAYVTATDTRSGVEYLIGITSRVEVGADGKLNPAYNVVHSAADRRQAKALANDMKRTLAFIAIPLRKTNGSYAAFFGELAPLGFPIEVPMLPHDRLRYRQLAAFTPDHRVKRLFAN